MITLTGPPLTRFTLTGAQQHAYIGFTPDRPIKVSFDITTQLDVKPRKKCSQTTKTTIKTGKNG
jgi:hypothetical protein